MSMEFPPRMRGGPRKKVFALAALLLWLAPPARSQQAHPWADSAVYNLPLSTQDRFYEHLALSPDGNKLYVCDAWQTVFVLDTAADTLLHTITLPNDESIGDIGFSPDGRLFISTEYSLFEIDPLTDTVVHTLEAPWYYYGPMAFSPDSTRAYVGAGDDLFVVDISGAVPAVMDLGDDVDTIGGLVAANPGWAEFDTGSTRLCFHGNKHYKTDLSGDHMKYNHIVLCAGDIETVSGLREKFLQNGYAEKELYDVERGDVSVLVEVASQSLIAECMLGCSVFHLDNSLWCHTCRWSPTVHKNLVPIRVCEPESGVFPF